MMVEIPRRAAAFAMTLLLSVGCCGGAVAAAPGESLPGLLMAQESGGAAPGDSYVVMEARRSARDPNWTRYPAVTLDQLHGYRPTGGVALNRYGGHGADPAKATGNFYAKKENDRWWLIDPLGGHFVNAGLVAVAPGASATLKKNLAAKFGSERNWARQTVALLKDTGFNGAGAWSDVDALRQADDRLVYTVIADFLSSFAASKGLIRPSNGHSGYVKDSIPVFLPDFPEYCEQFARAKLAAYKDDPWLLGVFSDNELLTPNLKKFLTLDPAIPEERPNYEAAHAWLVKRLGKPDVSANDVTVDIDLEFQAYVFERYFAIVSKAIKAVLPHHLYLGPRLNTERDKINPYLWKAAGKYVDVIALNLYRTWTPDIDQIHNWNTWSGKPVLITEWYVKGDDAGFPNTSGAGWIVRTQADRGRFYQQFVINLLKSKGIVGWHWFKYMDNDPDDVNADISNRDSNKGMMRLNYEPYSELTERMKRLNRELYPLIDYLDRQ